MENKDEGTGGTAENLIASLVVYYLRRRRSSAFLVCFLFPLTAPTPTHLLIQPPSISLLNNGETLYYVPVCAAEILRMQEWLMLSRVIFVRSCSNWNTRLNFISNYSQEFVF